MIDERTYTTRPMRRDEVDLAVDWAAAEGWNPGLDDAACFFAADAGGFHIGLLNGTPVATMSAVRYGDRYAFLGLYVVKPEWRDQGFGFSLYERIMRGLSIPTIGLDGVLERQADYAQQGFKVAHLNTRYERSGRVEAAGTGVEPLAAFPLSEVLDYDRGVFLAPRTAFLERWIRPLHGTALGVRRAGKLAGYGVVRQCRRGSKIGPLFADNPEAAEPLFTALAARAGESPVYLDVPAPNAAAVALAERYGMRPVFATARMYTGEPLPIPLDRVFGITTFELG